MIAAALAAALIAGPPPAAAPTEHHPIVVGERRMSRGFLRHWADIAQRLGADRAGARPAAARLLIEYRWIAGEAAERGVVVTRTEVDRALREQREQSFPRRRDYRTFLRDSGQSRADVRWRVRMQLHSDRLRELATAGAATPEEQQERLDAFVVAYRSKWRARTACRRPWISENCGVRGAAG